MKNKKLKRGLEVMRLNPKDSPLVANIKKSFAKVYDEVDSLAAPQEKDWSDYTFNDFVDSKLKALQEIKTACMWAVNAATTK